MDERTELQRIGDGLDNHCAVRVKNRGIVVLDDTSPNEPVQETENEQQRKPQRSAARQGQRPARRKGSSRRPRPPRAQARIVDLSDGYLEQQKQVADAYPGSSLTPDRHGVWLTAESEILTELDRSALFVIALPSTDQIEPRGWAFWKSDADVTWIGRRHTNMVDGSVCAFHMKLDGAWQPGGDLRTLLDLYSVWALRHAHLEIFERWPGRQYAMPDEAGRCDPYYRLIELRENELCSCGSDRRYGSCCRPHDLSLDFLAIKAQFDRRCGGARLLDRAPPSSIISAIEQWPAITLPPISEAHLLLKHHLGLRQDSPNGSC